MGGAGEPARRLQRLASLLPVVGDQCRQLVQPGAALELDRRPRHRRVRSRPPLTQLGAVGDLAGQRVAEGEQPFRVELGFVEEAGVGQRAEARVQLPGLEPGAEPQRPLAELLADHRGDLQQLLVGGVEAVDAGGKDRLDVGRHPRALHRPGQPVAAALALQPSGLGQLADDLLDEERVAGGTLVDWLLETVQRGVLAGDVAQHLARVSRSERSEGDAAVGGSGAPGGLVFGPVVDHQQRLGAADRLDQVGQHPLAALVDPVQVLDHDHDRVAPHRRARQPADDPAQRPLPRLAADLRRWPVGIGDTEEVEQQRQVASEVGIEQQRPPGDPFAGRPRRFALADPEVGAQHLQHRHERDRLAVGLSLRLEDLELGLAAALRELVAEPALAGTGFGGDPDRAALAGLRSRQRRLQRVHLLAATDEAREATFA